MSVYALLWQLIGHALHGRGRDTIHLAVTRGNDPITAPLSGELEHVNWTGDEDAFFVLTATDHEPT